LETIFETTGGPTAFIADQKCCVKMANISEKLEKAGGKSRPWSEKFVSKSDLHGWIPDKNIRE